MHFAPVRPFVRFLLTLVCALVVGASGHVSAQGTGVAINPAGGEENVTLQGEVFSVNNVAYSFSRPVITSGDISITADRIRLDYTTQQIEADGNVIYSSPDSEVRGERGRYDFRRKEGVAWGVEGVHQGVFFRAEWDEETQGPSFRRISEDEALFRGASWTTSGFPVPTWHMKAKEIILFPDDRVFMREAKLYVRGVPVLYFPIFTYGFREDNPWTIEAGVRSRYGVYLSIGYLFRHEARVPDWNNDEKYRTRSRGNLRLRSDLFSGGAVGIGTKYRYEFGFRRHIGDLELYGIRDSVREVRGDNDKNRYVYRHRHNSVFGNTIWQLNADWMSDPDMYQDFLDPLSDVERGRIPERRFRAAVTYLQEDWLARFSTEFKDRITLDEYQDPAEPLADNLNYDPDPNFRKQSGDDIDGISEDRYGRVSEKFNGRVATRLLPFFRTPLHWQTRANAFSALDAGFNEFDDDDDARYTGGDLYGSLTHRTRLDGDGRFTWLNTVGAGIGHYDRSDDSLIDDDIPVSGATSVGGLTYLDDDEVLVSNGTRNLDYSDVDPTYLWVDYRSRLNARFTENVSGFVQYTLRDGTSRGVGGFWERSGRTEIFEDTYDFPQDEHWVEGQLHYSPLYPKIDLYLTGGYNLQQDFQLRPNEKLYYAGAGAEWENDSGEWVAASELLFQGRQARDRRDPGEYDFTELSGNASLRYVPLHGRYWGGLLLSGRAPFDDDPVRDPSRRRRRFDETSSDLSIRPTIGKQFGPKYAVEVSAEYSTRLQKISEAGITVQRDLYDADLFVFAGMKENTFRDRDKDRSSDDRPDSKTEFDFRVGLRFKTPDETSRLSAVSIKTMRDREREASFVE